MLRNCIWRAQRLVSTLPKPGEVRAEPGTKTKCLRERLERGAAEMDSMRKPMCLLNIRACEPFQVITQIKMMSLNRSVDVSFKMTDEAEHSDGPVHSPHTDTHLSQNAGSGKTR